MMEALGEMDLGILAARKDAFLNLSFSNKLAEYVCMKVPVVSSDLDTTKYYFSGEQVLYFRSGDVDDLARKIRFAYMNRGSIQKMAESAYERYRSIDWQIMVKRYLKVIEGSADDENLYSESARP
jgi:glycosyltransferase involved in cell wall biosynthesis